jgi:uncharacterized protein YjbI with pentapeptide repeats
MANEEHLARLKQGVAVWNQWREANLDIKPDLTGADLFRATLTGADLTRATLTEAILTGTHHLRTAHLPQARLARANLVGVDLSRMNLVEADLTGAILARANLMRATLTEADLTGINLAYIRFDEANLTGANLTMADLTRANLTSAILVETKLGGVKITGCRVYGIAAWNVHLAGAQQLDLVITPTNEPEITVDNLEVAQFIYLLLHNEKIRQVIDTITSKAVLILGRFTPERKAVLDAIRDELRHRHYLPIVFDFERPTDQDFTETIMTLAGMCLFIIADITNPKSSPLELQATVPN